MRRTQLRPGRKLRISVLVAAIVALSSGGLPHTPPATAAPDPNAWVEPPALDWPATDPIVESEEVGYLPGGGSITAAGDYTYTLPIQVPDGRAGMQPHVALQYSSRGASGLLGAGWSLDFGGSEIARCPKTTAVDGGPSAVEYVPTGALCLDGQRMIAVGGPAQMGDGAEYRTERDSFAKIVAHGDTGLGPDRFEVFIKGGVVRTYMALEANRVTPPSLAGDLQTTPPVGLPEIVRPVWVLEEERDRDGNAVLYHYEVESESEAPYAFEHRIRSIEYTGRKNASGDFEDKPRREVVFSYSSPEQRPDPSFRYANGVRHRLTRRLTGIATYAPSPDEKALTGQYVLAYDTAAEGSAENPRTLLASVQRTDRKGRSLWRRTFEWEHAQTPELDVHDDIATIPDNLVTRPLLLDVDNDGKEELIYAGQLFRTTAGAAAPFDSAVPGGDVWGRPTDVDGDGKMEVLSVAGDHLVFTKWNPATQLFEPTPYTFTKRPIDFVDADGDGRIDAFQVGPRVNPDVDYYDEEWYFLRNTGDGFAEPVPFPAPAMPFRAGARKPAALDLNGDGRGELHVDYATYEPDGPSDPPLRECPPNPLVPAAADWHFYALEVHGGQLTRNTLRAERCPSKHVLADLNGDGLKDILVLDSTPPSVRYNTGAGFLPPVSPGLHVNTNFRPADFQVVDFDGDGRDDILSSHEVDAAGAPLPGTRLYLRHAHGFETIDLGAAPYHVPAYDPYPPGDVPPPALQAHSPTIEAGDVNGDGLTDLVVFERDMALHQVSVRVLEQRWSPRDVIVHVRDEIDDGPRESVFYSAFPNDSPAPSDCAYPQRCVRHGMLTAREHWVHRQDEPSAIRRTAYSFEDPRSDVRGRGFLGFGKVRSVDLDSHAETLSVFDNVTRDDRGRYPFAGLPRDTWQVTPILRTSTHAGGGVLLPQAGTPITARVRHTHTEQAVHLTNDGRTYFVVPQTSQTSDWEQHVDLGDDGLVLLADGSETAHRVREGSQVFDDLGNETESTVRTVAGQRCESSATFANLTGDWRIGERLTSEVGCNQDGLPLPEKRLTAMSYDDRGHVAQITVEPNHPELTRVTTFSRNIYGQVWRVVATVAGEPARKTYLAYDAEHVYPRATCNALNQCSRQLVHPAYGVPVVGEDENGVQVAYRYDGFGRVREAIPQDGIASETSYREDPVEPWGLVVAGTSADGGESVTRVDEWGRTLWAAHRGFDGNWVYHRAGYNLFGQATQAWRPSIGQAPSLVTETTFDTLGRAVSVVEPNGATTTMTHAMFETITTDPEGHQSRVTRDVDDRVTQTANLYEGSWVGMTYLYGAFSQVEDVVDPANNVVHAMYDKLGRRFLQDDPDRGTTMWSYNGFGEVTSEIDALGDTTAYDHDLLGRVTWTSHDVNGVTTFAYDGQNQPGERGRLTFSSSPDGVAVSYAYDTMGRSSDTTWQVGSDVYTLHRDYDSLGRLRDVRYPKVPNHDSFVARYDYNPHGYASAVRDWTSPASPKLLWQVDARNADGLLTEGKTGNDFTETRQYDPATGQLTQVEAVKSGDALFAVSYHRDLTGNILSRNDFAAGDPRAESFEYDELDRLKVWSLRYNHHAETTKYGYDVLGNIDTVTTPAGVETHGHTGQLVNGVQRFPHALTTRTMGAQSTSYLYDDRGRQVLGQGREITWKPFDLPSTIHQDGRTTTFSYDAFGGRVRKVRTEQGKLVDGVDTIGGLYERRWSADGATEHVMTVNGTDGPVAQIVVTEDANDPGRKLYVHQEALGSVGLVTDSLGGEVQRTYFDPFGAKVDAYGAVESPDMGDVKLGFTGHRHDDELGLIDMRGRVYDPAQKRFLSPDPHVTDPLFGQNYNRYSYVLNNPLRFTDPTGFDQNAGDLKRGPEPTGLDATAQEAKSVDVVAEIWAPVVDVIGKSDDAGPQQADKKRQKASDQAEGWSFYLHMAWGAAYQLVGVLPPVAAAKQVGHNFQVVGNAASLADRGEWDLAANALAELPQENAEAAARILTAPINAALAIPGAIDTALNSTDPEKKGAAAVAAIQEIATVAVAVVGAAKAAGEAKGPPNPWGKKGGPEHRAKVAEVAEGVRERGLTSQTEHMVKTPGGEKGVRYVDVVGRDSNKKVVEMHQVGRQTASGEPVAREVRAMDDIEHATGQRPDFHAYK